jgi:hypothetical protein
MLARAAGSRAVMARARSASGRLGEAAVDLQVGDGPSGSQAASSAAGPAGGWPAGRQLAAASTCGSKTAHRGQSCGAPMTIAGASVRSKASTASSGGEPAPAVPGSAATAAVSRHQAPSPPTGTGHRQPPCRQAASSPEHHPTNHTWPGTGNSGKARAGSAAKDGQLDRGQRGDRLAVGQVIEVAGGHDDG